MTHLALPRLFALLAAALLPFAAGAADATPAADAQPEKPKSFAERLTDRGVKLQSGPAIAKLGGNAEYKLAAGEHFVGADSIELFYKLTQNSRNGREVGVVVADAGWMLFFDYEDTGHVKDDEKLDADKLLKSMQEGQEAGNKRRKEQGWDEMRINGWAQPPHYDEKTHNLKWAMQLSSSSDGYKETWINESIRLLGRTGVMSVTLVTSNEEFAAHSALASKKLATDYAYVSGHKYTEFKSGDKVAAYGLSALVLGGGVAVAAKMGWLAKFWKLLVFGAVAVAGFFAKIFRKITGREEPPTGGV